MLQLEFDKEHDLQLTAEEKHFNKHSRGGPGGEVCTNLWSTCGQLVVHLALASLSVASYVFGLYIHSIEYMLMHVRTCTCICGVFH